MARDRPDLVALIESLWSHPVFELRLAAVEVAIAGIERLDKADLALVERLIRESETWALVDALAPRVAGPLLQRYPEQARKFAFCSGGALTPRTKAYLEKRKVLVLEKPLTVAAVTELLQRLAIPELEQREVAII